MESTRQEHRKQQDDQEQPQYLQQEQQQEQHQQEEEEQARRGEEQQQGKQHEQERELQEPQKEGDDIQKESVDRKGTASNSSVVEPRPPPSRSPSPAPSSSRLPDCFKASPPLLVPVETQNQVDQAGSGNNDDPFDIFMEQTFGEALRYKLSSSFPPSTLSAIQSLLLTRRRSGETFAPRFSDRAALRSEILTERAADLISKWIKEQRRKKEKE